MKGPEHAIELFHGYTYSAHPLACAAALATLDLYRDEDLFGRAKTLEPVWAEAIHSLRGLPNVLDIRTVGLVAAIDLASKPDAVGARAFEAMDRAFHEHDLMVRMTGDTLALTPPLIITRSPDRRDRRQAAPGDLAPCTDAFSRGAGEGGPRVSEGRMREFQSPRLRLDPCFPSSVTAPPRHLLPHRGRRRCP